MNADFEQNETKIMKIDAERIIGRANELYAQAKLKGVPANKLRYMAPETLPQIQSDQVKCAVRALVEALNQAE